MAINGKKTSRSTTNLFPSLAYLNSTLPTYIAFFVPSLYKENKKKTFVVQNIIWEFSLLWLSRTNLFANKLNFSISSSLRIGMSQKKILLIICFENFLNKRLRENGFSGKKFDQNYIFKLFSSSSYPSGTKAR